MPTLRAMATGKNRAGIHLANAANVRLTIGCAAAQHAKLIDLLCYVRQPIADPNAGFAMLLEFSF